MYFPKFFHPDPTVKRRSGFLKPQFNSSQTLGSSLYVPYFKTLGPSKDLTFNPTSTNDFIFFSGYSNVHDASAGSGGTVYVMYGTSTSISSSDTKVQFHGTHSNYTGSASDYYRTIYNTSILPCTGLSAGTNYYAELAGATHNSGNNSDFNHNVSSVTSDGKHGLMLIHYKKN